MKTIVIKNLASVAKTYAGQLLDPAEEYTVQSTDEQIAFSEDGNLFTDVGSGDAQIGNGSEFLNSTLGWSWLTGDFVQAEITQTSSGTSKKVATHTSTKPIVEGKTYYATWAGAGDDMATGDVGSGPLAVVECPNPNSMATQKAEFHPNNGEVHLFNGYIQWEGAAVGDCVCVEVRAAPTPVQQLANLDLLVDGDGWISYSPGGPGTGTHGFGGVPSLIVRSFSKDGQWDYSSETGLIPNFTNTGGYKISTQDKLVHRFVNRMPMIGSSYGMFTIDSSEATLVPQGLYVQLEANTGDNATGNLTVSSMMFLWREVTGQPT